jgi:hypothetical protein
MLSRTVMCGIQRVVLEHHGDVPFLGHQRVDHAAADGDLAGADLLQARDHAQQGGLAAARGPHQHRELPVLDVDVHAADDVRGAEVLLHRPYLHCGHLVLVGMI